MKSIKEIVEETVAYYSEDVNRRAKNANGGCSYYTGDKRMCAVGRCLYNPELYGKDGRYASSLLLDNDGILKTEYQGHPKEFWTELQSLHDHDDNWDIDGLSEDGKVAVEYILETFN